MFYLARIKAETKKARATGINPVFPPFGWHFDEPLHEPMPVATAVAADLSRLPDFWQAGDYLCASRQVVDILAELNDSAYETYPLEITDEHGRKDLSNFNLFRFRNHLECMDMEKSEYKLAEEGYVDRIRRLVLDERKIPEGRHFFALSRRPTVNVASERFASRWRELALSGREFVPLTDVNYWF